MEMLNATFNFFSMDHILRWLQEGYVSHNLYF